MNRTGRFLAPGSADGTALVLSEPLSFWGGVDPGTGVIVDRLHPDHGACVTRRILVMPGGRGSSSSASVLAEMIRLGTGPAGIFLARPDPILATGSLVAGRLYGRECPVVLCDIAGIAMEASVTIAEDTGGQARLSIDSSCGNKAGTST